MNNCYSDLPNILFNRPTLNSIRVFYFLLIELKESLDLYRKIIFFLILRAPLSSVCVTLSLILFHEIYSCVLDYVNIIFFLWDLKSH